MLRTHDDSGRVRDTRLWIIDDGGSAWVVTRPWGTHVRELTADPRIELLRHATLRATADLRHRLEARFDGSL